MAPPAAADAPARSRVAELLELLAPAPGRMGFALRLALICALTTLVVETYRTPDAALVIYLVFFLNKPARTASIALDVALVILISVVIGVVLLVAARVADDPAWRVASIALLSFGLLFLASASKLRPLAATIALIVGYSLDLLGQAPGGELATRGLLYGFLFVGIPAGVSLVVNLLIAPSPRRLLQRTIADRLQVSAPMLRAGDAPTRKAFRASLEEAPGETAEWLTLSRLEATPPADLAALRQAAESSMLVLLLVDMMNDEGLALPEDARGRLAGVLDEMSAIFRTGAYPVEVELPALAAAPLDEASASLLSRLGEVIARMAEPPPAASEEPAPPKAAGGFFLPDAFTDPKHVRYALKTTGAAMFCYILYSLLDWQSIHTCFITCYIVAQPTAAESIEKMLLRVTGCLLGAVAGLGCLVFVMPGLTSVGQLMGVVFAAAFIAAWVAAGPPRIAYAGFQFAFAFFLSVVQGSAPAFDLTIARDRTIGILLGDLVTCLVFVHVWPATVAPQIGAGLRELVRKLEALAGAATFEARRRLVGPALEVGAALRRDFELVGYEPARLRPGAGWLRTHVEAAELLAGATGPLLMAGGVRAPDGGAPDRLRALCEAIGRATAAGGPSGFTAMAGRRLAAAEALISGDPEMADA